MTITSNKKAADSASRNTRPVARGTAVVISNGRGASVAEAGRASRGRSTGQVICGGKTRGGTRGTIRGSRLTVAARPG